MSKQPEAKDEFFVGWRDKVPTGQNRFLQRYILTLSGLIALVGAALVISQRGFADSVFEFGEIRVWEGIYLADPVPMLKIRSVNSNPLEPTYERILLVGFGKRTALHAIGKIEAEHGPLQGKAVRLRGTLIYHEGKRALELTEEKEAFDGWGDESIAYPENVFQEMGRQRWVGEILDPKCALGVMKPGFGKPHRSCAIRCISGGIPPVLRVQLSEGRHRYFLLTGPHGEPINQEVLPYVADPLRICGELARLDDWYVLRVDPRNDISRLASWKSDVPIPMCQQ
jgi:hypothetical protein